MKDASHGLVNQILWQPSLARGENVLFLLDSEFCYLTRYGCGKQRVAEPTAPSE